MHAQQRPDRVNRREAVVSAHAERLAAHGIRVRRHGRDRWFVPMRQDQRGLIPPLLDAQAVEEMVAAERVYC